MPTVGDPYEVLGVPRDAGMEQVRQAYHRAALRCHPDNCPADPVEAARRFSELTDAYRTVIRTFGGRSQTLSPQDFARSELGWSILTPEAVKEVSAMPWNVRPHKVAYPTVNETRVFVFFWVLAIALAAAAASLLAGSGLLDGLAPKPTAADLEGGWNFLDILIAATPPLLVYAAVIAATIAAIILRRKIIWLVRYLGFGRLLPGPRKERALPRASAKLPPEAKP